MDKARYTVDAPHTFTINLLSSRGYHLKSIVKKEKSISFTVNAKDRANIEALMNKQNLNFHLDYTKGSITKLKSLFMRYGLIAGSIVGLFFLTVYSLSLVSIRIEGLNNVNADKILEVIETEGIKLPSFYQTLDTKKISENITKIDGVFGASVHKDGTVLVIKVQEELTNSGIADTQTPTAVISEYDGIITRLIVLQGTALKKKGDTVRKGEVIIAPYILDSNGNKIELKALGEAYATVYFQEHTTYSDTIITKVKTGEAERVTSVEVLGFKSLAKSSFSTYEKEESYKIINGIVPLKLITTTFYETKDTEIPFDFEKEKENIIENRLKCLLETTPDKGLGGKSWYIVKRVDNLTYLSVYYEVEIEIT